MEAVYFDRVVLQLFRGEGAWQDAIASVGRGLGLTPAEVVEMLAAYGSSQVWDTELLAFIRALRPRWRTGVITNDLVGARDRIKSHVNSDTFDVIVTSAEEGVAKPEPEIYDRALERLEVAAEETVFVDDLQPNVEGARAVGMHGILYTNSLDIRNQITRLIQS
jgi:putative hydrolase of the HAD superfamily